MGEGAILMSDNQNIIDGELVARVVSAAVAEACQPLYQQNAKLRSRIMELEAELSIYKFKEGQS